MKTLINKSKKIYQYNCDRCGEEISFKDNTMKQLYVESEYNKKYKFCDLCNRCFKSLQKGVFNNEKSCKNVNDT